ncbi:GGDEF domain-containing protein [[Clostridium] innocuum]|nr:GGDEF domain-containing protein [[Clostridium] innocuum]
MDEQLKILDEEIKKKRACNDLEGMQTYSAELRKLSHAKHNRTYEALAYYYSTLYHYLKKENAQAMRDCLSGLSLCENDEACCEAYILLSNFSGVLYSDQDNLLSGLQQFLNAYYKSLEHPKLHLHHLILNNLGTLFIKVEDFDNALKYLQEGYEERRKNKIPFDRSDAVLITNITIAYAQLKRFDQIPPWQRLFEENSEKMGVSSPFLNYLLTLAYMDAYHNDFKALQQHVREIVSITNQEQDVNNTFQLLSFLFDICLTKKDRSLCDHVYQKMEHLVSLVDNPLMLARLSNQYIRLLSEFKDEKLKDALLENYQLNLQAKKEEQKRGRQSLALKMELEESQYQQKKIMAQNERLRYTSELDGFTGIYHKKAFQEHADELIKKVNQHNWGALLILDIDHFKEVNDTYGHLAGDEAILRIVDIMKKVLQTGDICGRIGGDEFSIFLCGLAQEAQVQKIMQSILKQVHEIRLPGLDMTLTMSIGCCLIQKPCSFTHIYRYSDQALYKAKEKGRNQAYLYKEQFCIQEN